MKENVRASILQATADQLEHIRVNAPALYWGMKYHRNSRGEPMTFKGAYYLLDLYSRILNEPRFVVEKSVQCGLSELFIIASHIEAMNGLSVMYVLPKYELRNRFVNNRIYKLHRRAPKYQQMTRQGSQGGIHRTSLMHFGKGTLAYVGSNVEDEFIEMPVDSAFVDERDRCNQSNLELLPDRYTASPYKHHREISNPTVEGFAIDERYQKSSQGTWVLKCNHCGKHFTPDFFRHVVRQVGERKYEPLDPNYDPDIGKEISLIHDCGKPVNRLIKGEWVHKYPAREWQGYRISKLFNKFASLIDLFNKWVDAQGNETKLQVFYNSDLGLPFTAKGAKITTEDLNRCRRDYPTPKPGDGVRIIGVDVGAVLHYVVREVVSEKGYKCRRMVACGTVPSFELLQTEVLDRWNPRMTVIDAYPEIHKVMELKAKNNHLYSSKFQDDQRKMAINKNDREVSMDRTALLDYVKQHITEERVLNPINAQHLENGEYYSHMTASTRILEIDDDNPEKNRFVWVHTAPDHFFLAEAYCTQAAALLPNADEVVSFMQANTTKEQRVSHIEGLTDDQRAELERLSLQSPEIFLENLRRGNKK